MTNPVRLLLRVPVPWVFVLCYLLGVALEHFHHTPVSALGDKLALIAGYILFIAGAIIAGWGLFLFRSAGTTTVPGRLSAQFVRSGPYRFTRNPMYLGHLIFLLGLALTFRSWFALLILGGRALWFHRRVLQDEERLKGIFGVEYAQYLVKVKRWIPGVL